MSSFDINHLDDEGLEIEYLEKAGMIVENIDTQQSLNLEGIDLDVLDKPNSINEDANMQESTKEPPEIKENLLSGIYKDLDECYAAYNDYGYFKGFSIRKGKQYYYPGTRDLRIKWYFCSCQGVKDEKSSAHASHNKFDERTDCGAKISFEKGENGMWQVSNFVAEHNHVLALPHERHFLKSQRRITKPTGNLLESFVNSGMKPIDGISYLIEESGGPQNVSFIPKDAYNYLQSVRKTKMGASDATGLFSYFRNKKEEDPMFDWDFQLDEGGRLANIFWRDGKSRLDYDYFGDVVSFDTTYRTNKYGLKCAVFVGVNNHWRNIILGCAFLSWETTESFEWLFKTFLGSMGGKQPVIIFTDQAQAIINAVHSMLPDTRHRLCQWHISQNATSHIGSLNGDKYFWSLLHKCYSKCDTVEEFEKTWMAIKSIDVHGNKWLDRLYELRHKWSTAFNNDVFNAGIKSTSRSESTNHVLNGISNFTTSLYDFVVAFEKRILSKWRENERHDDFRCSHSRVPRANNSSPLLLHASQVYTHTTYKLFENEVMSSSLSYSSTEIPLGQAQFAFEIYKKVKPWKIKRVLIDMETLEVRCPCRKFESMGILCRHSLRALDMKNVHRIPDQYIMKRWQKDVRDSNVIGNFGSMNEEPDVLYSNHAMRYTYGIISKSRPHKEARSIVWKHLNNANLELNEFLRGQVQDEFPSVGDKSMGEMNSGNVILQDPPRIRPKGGKNQRKKSHLEKRKKHTGSSSGKKKKTKTVSSLERTSAVPENQTSPMDH